MTKVIKETTEHSFLKEQIQLQAMVEKSLAVAQKKGASQIEAFANSENGFSVSVRKGEVETLEYNRDKVLAITVYFGQRRGSASTSDMSEDAIEKTITAACDIAQYTEADAFSGLAEKQWLASDYPDLDLYHPWDITPDQAMQKQKHLQRISGSQIQKELSFQHTKVFMFTQIVMTFWEPIPLHVIVFHVCLWRNRVKRCNVIMNIQRREIPWN
jgi:predicted Zn-dependent protease